MRRRRSEAILDSGSSCFVFNFCSIFVRKSTIKPSNGFRTPRTFSTSLFFLRGAAELASLKQSSARKEMHGDRSRVCVDVRSEDWNTFNQWNRYLLNSIRIRVRDDATPYTPIHRLYFSRSARSNPAIMPTIVKIPFVTTPKSNVETSNGSCNTFTKS